jgi:hypothetical protein
MNDEKILELASRHLKLTWINDSPEDLIAFAKALIEARQNSESKLKEAIQNCLFVAGGRESEWGSRAEAALAFLHIAIDGEEE